MICFIYIRIFPTRFIRFAVQQQQQMGNILFFMVIICNNTNINEMFKKKPAYLIGFLNEAHPFTAIIHQQ